MNNNLLQPKLSYPKPWHESLINAGFTPGRDSYRLNGLTLKNEDRWFTLESASASALTDSLRSQLGQPGLWKMIPDGARRVHVFEFPETAVSAEDSNEWAGAEEAGNDLAGFVEWAIASKTLKTPEGWRPPTRELVESWLPSGALTVQCSSILRQGTLVLTPGRWALRFPILENLPAELPAPRREWLQLVLSDAQSLWRMVRVGIEDGAESSAVMAEVDFSGKPHSEDLFSAGLYGVRHVVAWLAETVELLADTKVESEVLAIHPYPNPKTERKTA